MMKSVICFVMFAVFTGCSGQLQQLAVETIENANVALTSAHAMGAEDTASTPLRTAEEMLTNAQNAMDAGDVEQAYRLALRAYLHARIATETAIALREEAQVQETEEQLTASEGRVDEALQRLSAIKAELDALQKM